MFHGVIQKNNIGKVLFETRCMCDNADYVVAHFHS